MFLVRGKPWFSENGDGIIELTLFIDENVER